MRCTVVIFLSCILFGCSTSEPNSTTTPIVKTGSEQVKDSSQGHISELEKNFIIQDLFKNQNSDVVNALAQENFDLAIKKIKHYWPEGDKTLSQTQKANLRYMHIYAFAGLVIQKKRTHAELEKLLETYLHQDIITQNLEITKGEHMPFNQVQVEQGKQDTIQITCANNLGINIHCFVEAACKTKYDLEKQTGKHAYVCGKLEKFKLSDTDVFSWIVQLKLSDGFLKILEDEFAK